MLRVAERLHDASRSFKRDQSAVAPTDPRAPLAKRERSAALGNNPRDKIRRPRIVLAAFAAHAFVRRPHPLCMYCYSATGVEIGRLERTEEGPATAEPVASAFMWNARSGADWKRWAGSFSRQ